MNIGLMTRHDLVRAVDAARVKQAVAEAESRTSGQIRVSVAPFLWGNPMRAAQRAFVRLGMAKTRRRNAVLFFIVPSRRRFVVLGDEGVHAKMDPGFWESVAALLADRFKVGDFTGGLVDGIGAVGAQLASHFPREDDVNELPDDVDFS